MGGSSSLLDYILPEHIMQLLYNNPLPWPLQLKQPQYHRDGHIGTNVHPFFLCIPSFFFQIVDGNFFLNQLEILLGPCSQRKRFKYRYWHFTWKILEWHYFKLRFKELCVIASSYCLDKFRFRPLWNKWWLRRESFSCSTVQHVSGRTSRSLVVELAIRAMRLIHRWLLWPQILRHRAYRLLDNSGQ